MTTSILLPEAALRSLIIRALLHFTLSSFVLWLEFEILVRFFSNVDGAFLAVIFYCKIFLLSSVVFAHKKTSASSDFFATNSDFFFV